MPSTRGVCTGGDRRVACRLRAPARRATGRCCSADVDGDRLRERSPPSCAAVRRRPHRALRRRRRRRRSRRSPSRPRARPARRARPHRRARPARPARPAPRARRQPRPAPRACSTRSSSSPRPALSPSASPRSPGTARSPPNTTSCSPTRSPPTSTTASTAPTCSRTYSISKRGVMLECRRRAAAWGARGARIVSVSPGLVVDTAIGAGRGDDPRGRLRRAVGAQARGRRGRHRRRRGVPDVATTRATSPAPTSWSTAASSPTRWTTPIPPTASGGTVPATESALDPVRAGRARAAELRNRLVMAPMGTCLDQSGHITDEAIAYYRRRAEGGVGTITVEGCLVSADTVGPGAEDQRPGVPARPEEARRGAKAYDVTVGVQLMHPGRQVVGGPTVAPSPVPLNSRAPVPHELTPPRSPTSSRTTRARPTSRARPASSSSRSTAPTATCRRTSSRRSTTAAPTSTAARWRTARASPSRSRARSSPPALPLVWRINGEDARAGRLRARRVRAGLAVAGGGGRDRDQRQRGHLAHAARDARADVRPARAHASHARRRSRPRSTCR